ncbi:tetracycline resistance MFS efflux pump [Dictyobacter alpinus]|uniref:Tetracycline resistance MFS efflux pump n=1 Tax=Dictyobacter alpinus TaxID=2014873 RepID=A0A402B733_9CHLR|nr:MFS transporter [Dictyobacter alpinus]GCE27164.1 tetracycline resistance MFS efflux pump [Dictyobacter alpinus]
MQQKKRSPLILMALTILIDFTGFGLIIPLLPFWAQHLGANPIGVGAIVTAYALAQFIFTPVLGGLSDRYGRRPVIIISLLIETLSFGLTALSGSLPMLLLARFVGGLGASNIGSAQAVVADVTPAKERAKGMGLIGAAIGMGFVIGPAMGGILSPLGPAVPFWTAAGIALLNALLVFFFLPETRTQKLPLTAEEAGETHSMNRLNVLWTGWQRAIQLPIVLRLILVNLLFTIAFTAMETIFPLFSQQKFGWGSTQNAYLFTYVGFVVVLMQGGLVGRLVKRWNEQKVMFGGLLLLAVGLIMLAFSNYLALVLISVGLLSIGDGAISPTISTLLSFASPAETQGELLGLAQGVAGLGRIIGPLIAGGVDTYSSAGIPLLIGGLLVLLATLVVFPILSRIQSPHDRKGSTILEAGRSQ